LIRRGHGDPERDRCGLPRLHRQGRTARNTTSEKIDEVARGRVWSGAQAKERGLVDRLGGLQQAIAAAAKRAGIEGKPVTRYIERELSGSERFVIDLVSQARLGGMVEFLGLKSPLTRLVMKDPELQQQLRLIGELQGKPFAASPTVSAAPADTCACPAFTATVKAGFRSGHICWAVRGTLWGC
jgi:hypothetical protein